MPDSHLTPARGEDPRVLDLLQKTTDETTRVVLVGFPTDRGVERNGGRVGAAEGPQEIRSALAKMTLDGRCPEPHRVVLVSTCDLGDIAISGDLERDQSALGSIVSEQLHAGRRVVVLGGGHETAYGHFLGYCGAGLAPVSIFNLDAHPDVRPTLDGLGHSGSPFRQALEHGDGGGVRDYQVAGLQPSSVAAAHLEYLRARQCHFLWAEETTAATIEGLLASLAEPAMVTLDLDAVDAAYAPGVSAPAVGGLAVATLLRAAEVAGRSPAVRSLEVVELNPRFDLDGRTAKLAALAVWRFLSGMAFSAAWRASGESG